MKNIEELKKSLSSVVALISDGEKEHLYNMAIKNGSKNILEIGSCQGASSICLASGMPDGENFLYCVDIWLDKTIIKFYENIIAAGVYWKICMIKQDANLILKTLSIKNVGLVFIDSGHSYEDNMTQVNHCLKFTEPGCVYAFHDYDEHGPNPGFPGVNKCCDELAASARFKKIDIFGSIYSMEQL
jgi:predicted O-methyltransferase YrrM